MSGFLLIATLVFSLGTTAGWADGAFPRSAAPAGARVVIDSPAYGAFTKSPVTVRTGLAEMRATSVDGAQEEGVHLHLIVDSPLPDASLPIPNDQRHRHFDPEQTEITLDLDRGLHTLQLVLGHANHMVHDPPVASEQIPIVVRNLDVKKLGGEESSTYKLSNDLAMRWRIDSEPSEQEDAEYRAGLDERRRARMEERAEVTRLLELLAEEIRRVKREKSAAQQRELILEIEEPPEH
jgi:hypothetical protein